MLGQVKGGFGWSLLAASPPATHEPKMSTFPLFSNTELAPSLKELVRLPVLTKAPAWVRIS